MNRPLDAQTVAERLRVGCRVAFDTNAVRQVRPWLNACSGIHAWAKRSGAHVSLHVSAQVHAEMVAHLRRQYGATFCPAEITDNLRSKGCEIVPFDETDADGTAAWLAGEYPSPDDWHRSKVAHVWRQLGQPGGPPEVHGCAGTLDWYIAGHAESEAA